MSLFGKTLFTETICVDALISSAIPCTDNGTREALGPNLDKKDQCNTRLRPLVKISTTLSLVWILWTVIKPTWIFSRMKWQWSSTCLVWAWYTGLAVKSIVALLSQYTGKGPGEVRRKSFNKLMIQSTSQEASVRALYSASTELLEVTCCFYLTFGYLFQFCLSWAYKAHWNWLSPSSTKSKARHNYYSSSSLYRTTCWFFY